MPAAAIGCHEVLVCCFQASQVRYLENTLKATKKRIADAEEALKRCAGKQGPQRQTSVTSGTANRPAQPSTERSAGNYAGVVAQTVDKDKDTSTPKETAGDVPKRSKSGRKRAVSRKTTPCMSCIMIPFRQ